MASNLTEIQAQQLNPLTPMAFLPPHAGYQATIAAYVIVGTLSVLIWDILMHVPSDHKLLFRDKIGIPTVVYCLSRLSVLVYILLNVIFRTAGLPNCRAIQRTICILYHVAFSSTAFLFFLRARAVYNGNRLMTGFFVFLWLGVLGCSLDVVAIADGVHLGPTRHCTASQLKPYASAASVALAVNDTFVFLAISWRILSNANLGREHKLSLKSIMLGDYLPTFSRALLQDGQVYYLVSVTSNIVVVIVTCVGVLAPYMFTNLALTNMMACQVFRHTKFGNFGEDTISTRQLASQLGQLDLEAGKEHVKSQIRFASFQVTKNDADVSDADLTREREANTGIWGEVEVANSAPMEKAEPRGKDTAF